MIFTSVLCILIILLANWIGRNFKVGVPLLIFGQEDTDTIVVYEPRFDQIFPIFENVNLANSNNDFFWSSDRRRMLKVTLDTQSEEDSAFIFQVYRDWHDSPIDIDGRFGSYSTPRWSPDGQSLILPACRQLNTGCGFWNFYLLQGDMTQFIEIDYPEIASLPRDWQWYNNDTLIVWQDRAIFLLDLASGAVETVVEGVPPQPRNIRWTDNFSRLSYQDGHNRFYCLYVLFLAEGDPREVTCEGINPNSPYGWLADGRTVYYIQGDDDALRLYDSVEDGSRGISDAPYLLDWTQDGLYPIPQTPYLLHHATFGRSSWQIIDTHNGEISQLAFTSRSTSRGDIVVPSPAGDSIVIVQENNGLLQVISLEVLEPQFIDQVICCLVLWD